MRDVHKLLVVLTAALVLVVSCGDDTESGAAGREPVTFENCGEQVTVEEPPERVVSIARTAVPLLESVGKLDRLVGRADKPALEGYDPEVRAIVEKVPLIGGQSDVSFEAVLGLKPNLVIGYEVAAAGVTRNALASAGVPMFVPPSFCGEKFAPSQAPTYDDIYSQVELFGRIFGEEERAAAEVAELRGRVAAVEQSVPGSSGRTAVTISIEPGQPPAVYGALSMSTTQLRTVGLTSVFGDVQKRRFEVSVEEIIAKKPGLIIIVHQATPEEATNAFLALPGVNELAAVRNGDILALRLQLTDPPTPLSIEGLEQIAAATRGP